MIEVYRVMRSDGDDLLIPARSQDDLEVPAGVTSTLSLGIPVARGGSFQGRFSEDPVLRYRQRAMHAIAFGSNYTSPFLHCTKSLVVAVAKLHKSGQAGSYLVKINLAGLSGSQPAPGRAGMKSASGSQPGEPNPVVVDMSSDKSQKAGVR